MGYDRIRYAVNLPERYTDRITVKDVYEFNETELPKILSKVIMWIVRRYGKQYHTEIQREKISEFSFTDFASALFTQDNAIQRTIFQNTKYILIGREKYMEIFKEDIMYPYSFSGDYSNIRQLYGKKIIVVPWMKDDFILLTEEMLNG